MKEITLAARTENIDAVTEFVNQELDAMGCPGKTRVQFDVAIDEIFANIACYASGPEGGAATVRFEALESPRGAAVTFLDSGTPFDPLQNEDPDVTLSAEDRPVGGLGIFLVKKAMDQVRYAHRNGNNILRIEKYF